MNEKDIAMCKNLEKQINEILEKDGFTAEAETLMDKIAWFCFRNNISAETYKSLVLQ